MNTYSFRSLVLPMLLIMVHQAAAENGYFAPATSYQVGSGPTCVATADVNGNGKIALISANLIDGTLMVLTNNGSGGFGSNDTLVVGSYPICVAAADVNGDGRPEVFSANYGDGTLTVLTNNGHGGFGSNATLNVGLSINSGPAFVLAADVNGDGKLDLISANTGDDTVTVLTNNRSGRFVLDATRTVGPYPVSVAAVDINGNGKIALVSANENNGTLTVLTNNGSGKFGYNATLNVGSGPSSGPASVVAADINGDGKPDLISANSGDGTLTVLTNNNSGGFGSNATLVVGSGPLCVTAMDVNGDGKPDLISANSGDGTLTVLTNNGSGGFGFHATLTVGFIAGSYPQFVVAADLNGDGLPDLVSANYYDNSLSVLLNGADAPVSPSLTISLTNSHTVVISWPSPSDGFELQQNSNLTTINWLGFSGTINTNTTTKSATISPATNNLFFRLRHP
jgi:FG-GAP-like repeat